jgi:hypothetical protein
MTLPPPPLPLGPRLLRSLRRGIDNHWPNRSVLAAALAMDDDPVLLCGCADAAGSCC